MADYHQLTDLWNCQLYWLDGWQVVELDPGDSGYAEPDRLAEAIWQRVSEQHPPMVVLEMGKVTFMSSSLMGKLVQLHKRIAIAGGEFHVACLGAHPTEALRACRLHTIIPQFESVAEAAHVGV